MAKPFFYFFSSDSRDLYLQNTLNVLALPHGSISRLSYDNVWVADALYSATYPDDTRQAGDLDYRDAPGLVVLIKQTGIQYTYYPLRYVKVVRLEWEGEVLFASVELGAYVDWRGLSLRELKTIAGDNLNCWQNALPYEVMKAHFTAGLQRIFGTQANPVAAPNAAPADPRLAQIEQKVIARYNKIVAARLMVYLSRSLAAQAVLEPDYNKSARSTIDIAPLIHSGLEQLHIESELSSKDLQQDLSPQTRQAIDQFMRELARTALGNPNASGDIAHISATVVPNVLHNRLTRVREESMQNAVNAAFDSLLVDEFNLQINRLPVALRPRHALISFNATAPDHIPAVKSGARVGDEAKEDTSGWQAIVEAISGEDGLPNLSNSVFYRIVGMKESQTSAMRRFARSLFSSQHSETEVKLARQLDLQNGYELQSGKSYSLLLTFFHSKFYHGDELREPVRGSHITAELDEKYFAYKPEPIVVDFRYDRRLIDFVMVPLSQQAYTQIVVGLDPADANKERANKKDASSGPEQRTYSLALRADSATLGLTTGQADLIVEERRPTTPHDPTGDPQLSLRHAAPLKAPALGFVLKIKPQSYKLLFALLFLAQLLILLGNMAPDLSKPFLATPTAIVGLATAPPVFAVAPAPTPAPTFQVGIAQLDENQIKLSGLALAAIGALITSLLLFIFLRKIPGA